jgi:hypothetical protein
MVNGTVNLHNTLLVKTCFLKLPIDIRCDNEPRQIEALYPIENDGKAFVRLSTAIEIGAMPIKTSAQLRILGEVPRIRDVHEIHPQLLVFRIRIPESLIVAKTGETGVNPHSSACGDNQAFSVLDRCRSICQDFLRDWIHPTNPSKSTSISSRDFTEDLGSFARHLTLPTLHLLYDVCGASLRRVSATADTRS